MEQLGPFHFFFTLSAAEMRWTEVTTAILHYEQKVDKIVYEKGWESDEGKIKLYLVGWETGPSDENENEKIKLLMNMKIETSTNSTRTTFCSLLGSLTTV